MGMRWRVWKLRTRQGPARAEGSAQQDLCRLEAAVAGGQTMLEVGKASRRWLSNITQGSRGLAQAVVQLRQEQGVRTAMQPRARAGVSGSSESQGAGAMPRSHHHPGRGLAPLTLSLPRSASSDTAGTFKFWSYGQSCACMPRVQECQLRAYDASSDLHACIVLTLMERQTRDRMVIRVYSLPYYVYL